MTDKYKRWYDQDCIRSFDSKGAQDFFESEVRFLKTIAPNVHSVLDIGCASGRMIELLNDILPQYTYCGIDIVQQSIENAQKSYPDSTFHHCNALEFECEDTFDLINATGVMQHEVKFEELVHRMIGWSNRYVLFDVKFANIDAHEVDIKRSYCGTEHKLNFVLLSPTLFVDFLKRQKNVKKISMFGYETGLNSRTVVPAGVDRVISAGVLLELGQVTGAAPTVEVDIPLLDLS
ncbi:class I SAM-dependent methyltransferase [Magnetovibrio sp.]|uniref:class I SAM-dependent methyltransferase n=1 Tax=Magnetovibrio sp. TaxID=2024836 RepID=UPI002F92C0E7